MDLQRLILGPSFSGKTTIDVKGRVDLKVMIDLFTAFSGDNIKRRGEWIKYIKRENWIPREFVNHATTQLKFYNGLMIPNLRDRIRVMRHEGISSDLMATRIFTTGVLEDPGQQHLAGDDDRSKLILACYNSMLMGMHNLKDVSKIWIEFLLDYAINQVCISDQVFDLLWPVSGVVNWDLFYSEWTNEYARNGEDKTEIPSEILDVFFFKVPDRPHRVPRELYTHVKYVIGTHNDYYYKCTPWLTKYLHVTKPSYLRDIRGFISIIPPSRAVVAQGDLYYKRYLQPPSSELIGGRVDDDDDVVDGNVNMVGDDDGARDDVSSDAGTEIMEQ
jgi:hypothetical protein